MKTDLPILEFDPDVNAVINPTDAITHADGVPKHCVLPIYYKVMEKLLTDGRLEQVAAIETALGPLPIYRMDYEGSEVAVVHPGVAAPLAAAVMEELIAFGCRNFIACGSCGVLDGGLDKGTIIVPDSAVRDEGTSYHYVAPSREIEAQAAVNKVIAAVLEDRGLPYIIGKTWTTDAFYRETKNRVAHRKGEGCLVVEMECAAFLAVAAFRGVRFGQLLSTEDDVSGHEWDRRLEHDYQSKPEQLFWLAVEACLRLG